MIIYNKKQFDESFKKFCILKKDFNQKELNDIFRKVCNIIIYDIIIQEIINPSNKISKESYKEMKIS